MRRLIELSIIVFIAWIFAFFFFAAILQNGYGTSVGFLK